MRTSDLLNLSLCAAYRADLALAEDDESRSHREWLSSDLWLSRHAATQLSSHAATPPRSHAAKQPSSLAATPPSSLAAKQPRRLGPHELLTLYHATSGLPEDRIVAYGNAIQSWLLSPEASSPRPRIADLNLPQLVYGALRRAGYTYLDQVSHLTDAQLLSVRNLGPKGLSLLRGKLQRG